MLKWNWIKEQNALMFELVVISCNFPCILYIVQIFLPCVVNPKLEHFKLFVRRKRDERKSRRLFNMLSDFRKVKLNNTLFVRRSAEPLTSFDLIKSLFFHSLSSFETLNNAWIKRWQTFSVKLLTWVRLFCAVWRTANRSRIRVPRVFKLIIFYGKWLDLGLFYEKLEKLEK